MNIPWARLLIAALPAMALFAACSDLGTPLPQAPGPDANCQLSDTSLDFGEVDLGSSAELTLTLYNLGDADLEGSAAIDSADFSFLANGGSFRVVPGDSLLLDLRFQPSAEGSRTGLLTLGTECLAVPLGGSGQSITPPGVSLANDLQPLFTNSCATSGCHLGSFARADMQLSVGRTYSETVGVISDGYAPAFIIRKNDPDASVLYNKVANTGTFGGPMPPRSNRFTPAQVAMLREWILAGAPNN